MKFTKVKLVGASTVTLPIVGATPQDPYHVKEIVGLGPTQIDVRVKSGRGGGVYKGRSPLNKQLVIRVAMTPDYFGGQTVEELREIMYGMITSDYEDPLLVELHDGLTPMVYARGWVSKCEINPFSKEPELQITIDTDSPYFHHYYEINYPVAGLSKAAPEFNNVGQADIGFYFVVDFTSDSLTGWNINNTRQKFHVDYDFLDNDRLTVNTRDGEQNITRTRSGSTISLLSYLTSDSNWLTLKHGLNQFAVGPSTGYSWYQVKMKPEYWGV